MSRTASVAEAIREFTEEKIRKAEERYGDGESDEP